MHKKTKIKCVGKNYPAQVTNNSLNSVNITFIVLTRSMAKDNFFFTEVEAIFKSPDVHIIKTGFLNIDKNFVTVFSCLSKLNIYFIIHSKYFLVSVWLKPRA